MLKFLIGLIFGVIVGAAAVLFFGVKGTTGKPVVAVPASRPGAIHVTIDQSYLNQLMTEALAGQPQFKGMKPTLALQAPNSVIVTVNLQANVGGTTLSIQPAITMQLTIEAGRIRTRVSNVNVGALTVPLDPFQGQINQIDKVMEDQANRAVASGLAGTGLKIVNVGTTNNNLIVDLGE
jgi:hypothetical protein